MPNRLIPLEKLSSLIKLFEEEVIYDNEAHALLLSQESNYKLRLPWQLDKDLSQTNNHFAICLIQTESASVGLVKDGQLIDHKTFSTYAVRKKQGKSQIKYLKTRGKSKAGSRLRLANTINFFEHINERLTTYFEQYKIEKIGFSCSKILLPYLYTSKVKCPFDKKDERIYKIPKHLPNANYEDLLLVHKMLTKGELVFEENQEETVNKLLSNIFNKDV